VCFYDAELVLSAIANVLVHLLGEKEGRVKMGVGGVGKRVGIEGQVWRGEKWECTQK